jgi:hypothetical protein
LENPEYAENYINGLVIKSKKLAKKMEQNPTYTQKKKYGREKDDSEFDDFLNDLGF